MPIDTGEVALAEGFELPTDRLGARGTEVLSIAVHVVEAIQAPSVQIGAVGLQGIDLRLGQGHQLDVGNTHRPALECAGLIAWDDADRELADHELLPGQIHGLPVDLVKLSPPKVIVSAPAAGGMFAEGAISRRKRPLQDREGGIVAEPDHEVRDLTLVRVRRMDPDRDGMPAGNV